MTSSPVPPAAPEGAGRKPNYAAAYDAVQTLIACGIGKTTRAVLENFLMLYRRTEAGSEAHDRD